MDTSTITPGTQVLAREIERQHTRRLKSKDLLKIGMRPDQVAKFERQKKPRGCLSRGMPNRRILVSRVVGGKRIEFHATKGWRVQRA